MRILILSNRYPPYYTGGYEIACQAVADQLRHRGHDLLVLTSNYGIEGIKIDGHVNRILHRPQDSPNLVELARWELHDVKALSRIVKDWKPSVIYAWNMLQLFPSLQTTLRDLPVAVVFNVQDIWLPRLLDESQEQYEAWEKPGGNILRRITKTAVRSLIKWRHPQWLKAIRSTDLDLSQVVFCSGFRRDEHIKLGLPLGSSRIIYNGIDPQTFDGEVSEFRKANLNMLFVGRLVHEKGPHTVIEAVAELARRGIRNVNLSIAGVPAYPWEYSAGLQELVDKQDLGNQVKFLGMIPNKELPNIYGEHDVLVFASIGNEGFPVTLIEAMSCGLAVVGTTTGGSSEILEDGVNSLTFPPDNAVALADCLSRLIQNPDFSRSLAFAGQRLVREKFDLKRITDQTEEYLNEVAQQPRQAQRMTSLI